MLESKAEVAGQIAGTSDTSLEGKFKLLGEADAVDVSILNLTGSESNRTESSDLSARSSPCMHTN